MAGHFVEVIHDGSQFRLISEPAPGTWVQLYNVGVGTGAAIDFISLPTAYDEFEFLFQHVYGNTFDDHIQYQFYIGTNTLETGANYSWQIFAANSGVSGVQNTAGTSTGRIVSSLGNTVPQSAVGWARLVNPNQSTGTVSFISDFGHIAKGGAARIERGNSHWQPSTLVAVTCVRFLWNSGGNFAGGRIIVRARRSS